MALWPERGRRDEKLGLGIGHFDYVTPKFVRRLLDILVQVRATNAAPMDWHRSKSHPLDKGNGKPQCKGLRLIHMMPVIGRAWYEQSLARGPEVKYGYFEHGGLSHRCRESAIL
eukprot:4781401-Heterocapsa_arctica.AAC.1